MNFRNFFPIPENVADCKGYLQSMWDQLEDQGCNHFVANDYELEEVYTSPFIIGLPECLELIALNHDMQTLEWFVQMSFRYPFIRDVLINEMYMVTNVGPGSSQVPFIGYCFENEFIDGLKLLLHYHALPNKESLFLFFLYLYTNQYVEEFMEVLESMDYLSSAPEQFTIALFDMTICQADFDLFKRLYVDNRKDWWPSLFDVCKRVKMILQNSKISSIYDPYEVIDEHNEVQHGPFFVSLVAWIQSNVTQCNALNQVLYTDVQGVMKQFVCYKEDQQVDLQSPYLNQNTTVVDTTNYGAQYINRRIYDEYFALRFAAYFPRSKEYDYEHHVTYTVY